MCYLLLFDLADDDSLRTTRSAARRGRTSGHTRRLTLRRMDLVDGVPSGGAAWRHVAGSTPCLLLQPRSSLHPPGIAGEKRGNITIAATVSSRAVIVTIRGRQDTSGRVSFTSHPRPGGSASHHAAPGPPLGGAGGVWYPTCSSLTSRTTTVSGRRGPPHGVAAPVATQRPQPHGSEPRQARRRPRGQNPPVTAPSL